MYRQALPMPESLDILVAVGVLKLHSPRCDWSCAVVAGTHLLVDAIIVSLPNRRASPREKIAALSHTRDAIDV